MTNKNVSQLPTNSTPQDSDWLLGASGDSPSVFQKIPVGSLIPTTQNSGSIKFSLPVNQNTALTSSGYYFTDNIAANIGIDCSGLGIGEHISWLNLSTKAVVFYGLSTVNGVTIPANQGIKIEANTSIEFFVQDNSLNIRVLAGNYTINWVPAFAPLPVNFTYVSDDNTNDILYYLGTDGLTSAFQNPHTRGFITMSESSNYGGNVASQATNRNNSDFFHSNSESNPNFTLKFNGGINALVNRIAMLPRSGGWTFNPFSVLASNDGSNWVTLASGLSAPSSSWYSPTITNTSSYFYYRFVRNVTSYADCAEIRLYGTLYFI
jgi:hypothetical protein